MDYHTAAQNLEIGQVVRIRRSDKVTITEVRVVEFSRSKDDRWFIAPEITTFRVEWSENGKVLTKGCCALDLVIEGLAPIFVR